MKKIGKWVLYGLLALLVLSFIGGLMSDPDDNKKTELEKVGGVSDQVEPNEEDEEVQPTSKWDYEETKDEMRGDVDYIATNTSINTVNLEFPYNGGTKLNILLRKDAEYGNDVMFAVNKGQLFCTYNDCYVSVKFDDGPVEKYLTNEAEAGASEVLFLADNLSGFVNKLKSADTVMIEVMFFNHGKEQFKFDVSDLEWDKF